MNKVFLKPNREKSLLKHHPWVYSGAIARVEGDCLNGSTVEVYSSKGDFLALAAVSLKSQLALRVWSFDRDTNIDDGFFAEKMRAEVDNKVIW